MGLRELNSLKNQLYGHPRVFACQQKAPSSNPNIKRAVNKWAGLPRLILSLALLFLTAPSVKYFPQLHLPFSSIHQLDSFIIYNIDILICSTFRTPVLCTINSNISDYLWALSFFICFIFHVREASNRCMSKPIQVYMKPLLSFCEP